MIKKLRLYLHWRKRKKGAITIEFVRGPGYYLMVGIFGHSLIGRIEEMKMKSDKTGIFKLVDYECYRDPRDMIKSSSWQFIGYKGERPVNECSFKEYLKLYHEYDKIRYGPMGS